MDLATNIDKTIVRVRPKSESDVGVPSFECSFSPDNELMASKEFAEGMMQIFESYEPAWFQANLIRTLAKALHLETEFHQK